MFTCVDSSCYQEGLTEQNLFYRGWSALSESAGSMRIIWLRPYTFCLSERLHWYSSNTDNINSQLITLWIFLPFTLQVCPRLPSIEEAHTKTSNHYQSAYREFRSTETDLFKIHNDILVLSFLQSWYQFWSPSRVSIRSSACYPLYPSTL